MTAGTARLSQRDGHEGLEERVHVEREPVDSQPADGVLDGRVGQAGPGQVQSLVVPGVEARGPPLRQWLSAYQHGGVRQPGMLVQEPEAHVAQRAGQPQQALHGRAQDAVLGDLGGELVVHDLDRRVAPGRRRICSDTTAHDEGGFLCRPVSLEQALPQRPIHLPLHGMSACGQQIAVPGGLDLPVPPNAVPAQGVTKQEQQADDGDCGSDTHGDRLVHTRHREGYRADLAAGP